MSQFKSFQAKHFLSEELQILIKEGLRIILIMGIDPEPRSLK